MDGYQFYIIISAVGVIVCLWVVLLIQKDEIRELRNSHEELLRQVDLLRQGVLLGIRYRVHSGTSSGTYQILMNDGRGWQDVVAGTDESPDCNCDPLNVSVDDLIATIEKFVPERPTGRMITAGGSR